MRLICTNLSSIFIGWRRRLTLLRILLCLELLHRLLLRLLLLQLLLRFRLLLLPLWLLRRVADPRFRRAFAFRC